jgi:hypothetical protein
LIFSGVEANESIMSSCNEICASELTALLGWATIVKADATVSNTSIHAYHSQMLLVVLASNDTTLSRIE